MAVNGGYRKYQRRKLAMANGGEMAIEMAYAA
jgi:hypothetical protein